MGKLISFAILLVMVITIIFPFMMVNLVADHFSDQNIKPIKGNSSNISSEVTQEFTVKLYDTKQDKLREMPLEEYVKGVVAAEMPASFELEALKAQAVAARTYVVNKMLALGKDGCSLHSGADVCSDPTHCQAWESEEEQKKQWGIFKYYTYSRKIAQAVDTTAGEIVVYDDQPILPAFHAVSGGKTENSGDVWAQDLPYLKSVISTGEEDAPNFIAEVDMTVDEFIKTFKSHYSDASITSQNLKNSISVLDVSEGGRVKTLKIGNVTLKGTEFRSIYNLNSTNFKIYVNGDKVKIVTIGYGHGVGMSQYGANSMAKEGKTYKDILQHYYSGVDIKPINDIYDSIAKK